MELDLVVVVVGPVEEFQASYPLALSSSPSAEGVDVVMAHMHVIITRNLKIWKKHVLRIDRMIVG